MSSEKEDSASNETQPRQVMHRIVLVQNPKSGLVLDAKEIEVKVKKRLGVSSQLWAIAPMDTNKYLFINAYNRGALQVQGPEAEGSSLTCTTRGITTQLWNFNRDGTITRGNLAIEILNGSNNNAAQIKLAKKTGEPNQIFEVQYL